MGCDCVAGALASLGNRCSTIFLSASIQGCVTQALGGNPRKLGDHHGKVTGLSQVELSCFSLCIDAKHVRMLYAYMRVKVCVCVCYSRNVQIRKCMLLQRMHTYMCGHLWGGQLKMK